MRGVVYSLAEDLDARPASHTADWEQSASVLTCRAPYYPFARSVNESLQRSYAANAAIRKDECVILCRITKCQCWISRTRLPVYAKPHPVHDSFEMGRPEGVIAVITYAGLMSAPKATRKWEAVEGLCGRESPLKKQHELWFSFAQLRVAVHVAK